MKKLLYILVLFTLLGGCAKEKDFLDREPIDRISDNAVFNNKPLVEAYLYMAYNYIPNGYEFLYYSTPGNPDPGVEGNNYDDNGAYMFDCLTDELTNKSGWPWSNAHIIPGQIYADQKLVGLNIWERAYKTIRWTNSIIEGLQESELEPSYTARIAGEARFIRSYFYFELAKRYGDVPLITHTQSLDNMDDVFVARTPVAEVYAFIDKEMAEAALDLPSAADLPATELGRATREACWALNGRAQLYAENYARSAEMSKKVIDANCFVLSPDYNALFQSYGGDKEVIFEILYDGTSKAHSLDRLIFPFSHRSDWGSQYLPTQEMVDAYEMTNGKAINDPASGYDPQHPYANRDSRLTASVLYHGNVFKGDTIKVALSSDVSILPNDVDALGLTGNHTTTGYYLKKFADENQPDGPDFGVSRQSWKEIRLGEVLLNYAEAQNEAAGPDASVYNAINQIRERAGQPDLPTGLSKDEMFARIVQERKVELFAEGFRYWDLRRWHMAVDVLNGKKVHGMKITKDANNPSNLTYELIEAANRPEYVFQDWFYLLPVPLDEMNKNPNLVQNPGYN